MKRRYLFPLLCTLILPVYAAGPGKDNDFGGKRVLVIGIDGLRPDAIEVAKTPNIDALIAKGAVTHMAYAGGELGKSTQQPTISGPGWLSVLLGVWMDKHKVPNNDFTPYTPEIAARYPHFYKRLKDARPNSYLSSIISWDPIEDAIVAPAAASFDYHIKTTGTDYFAKDHDVMDKAVAHLASADPDVLFIYFAQVDGAGHSTGFSPTNPIYIRSIEVVDRYIGQVMAAVKARPRFADEQWLVILTTDHGGKGKSHGGQSPEERNITLLVSGDAVNPHLSTDTPGHTAVPPTIFAYFGVPVDPKWQWASSAFGLPPDFSGVADGKHVILNWKLPKSGLPGLKGYELLRDGKAIAKLEANATSYLDKPGTGTYRYELRFLGTRELRQITVAPTKESSALSAGQGKSPKDS